MNIVVSISDFRNNLSDYIDLIRGGDKSVEVVDEKKDKVVGLFVAKKEEEFDWNKYMKFVKSLAGSGFLAGKKNERVRKEFRDGVNKRFEEARKR
ncbi:MAG: hypothetical protein Q8P91_00380 [bacterium]|nr:hypothetical protein [bacterium]